jgi:predicted LPLAT superfamily acyltransferase
MKHSTHRAQLEERSTLRGKRNLLQICLLFGRAVLLVFLYPVVTYYWLIYRSDRRTSQSNLSRVAKLTFLISGV